MKAPVKSGIRTLNAIGSLLIGLGVPLVTAWFLRAEGPIMAVLAASLTLNALFFLRARLRQRSSGGVLPRVGVTGVLALVFGVSALALLVFIVVIPFSYYLAWLDVVVAQRPGGMISFLFFAVSAWFAALFAGVAHSSGPLRPAAGAILVVLFEAAVIFRTPLAVGLFSVALILALVLLALAGKRFTAGRLVLPLGLLATAMGVGALFALGNPPNAGILTRTSLLADLKRAIVEVFPDLSALSSMAGYGFSFEKSDLGGKPILSSMPLLSASGDRRGPVYLRTKVYDDYFNNNWGVSRWFSDRIANNRDEILSGRLPAREQVRLTVLFDYLPDLPHTLSASSVAAVSDPPVEIAGGNFESGFDPARPLLRGTELFVYDVPAYTLTPKMAGTTRFFNLAPGAETRPYPAGGEHDTVLARYLVVPSSITPRIRDLARELRGKETDARLILANISGWLGAHCAYTLNTTVPPQGDEFLDDFLFVTQRGYCVHFATALCVLARLNNIPTRYATGFLAFLPGAGAPEQAVMVNGLNAHAWTEVWLQAYGWVALETTPAFDSGNLSLPDFYRRNNRSADELTARQLEALLGGLIPPPVVRKPGPAEFLAMVAPALPWVATTAGAAAFLAVAFALGRRFIGRRRLYRGALARFNRRLCRLVAHLERLGVPPPEETGWIAWGAAVQSRLPAERRHVRTLTLTAQHLFFARRQATARHVRFVRALSARIVRRAGKAEKKISHG
jgi:transglutaminase-like putative cysteine protease